MKRAITLITLFIMTFFIISLSTSYAQSTLLEEEAEAAIRSEYSLWNEGNQAAIVESGTGFALGFGFRTLAPRDLNSIPPAFFPEVIKTFFESMEYYRIKIEEIHTKAFGEVVVAWGFHTEDFKIHGKSPEFVRVRFTTTLRKTPSGWKTLIFHRDIQPFDSQGRYIPTPKAQ